MKRKILILTLVLLFSTALAEVEEMIPTFSLLTDQQQVLVRMLHQAAQAHQKEVQFPKKTAYQDAELAMYYVATEYTDIPALVDQWTMVNYSTQPEYATTIRLDYTFSMEEERKLNERTQAIAREMLNMPGGPDKELAIHDIVCRFVEYGINGEGLEHEAVGAIINGRAVCDGYSGAFALLCRTAGIPCSIVTGCSNGEGHSWNLVAAGSGYALVDVTWDDQEWGIRHCYYNLTDEQMAVDHWLNMKWQVPVCHVPEMEYCAVRGAVVSDPEEIVRVISRQIPTGEAEMRFTSQQLLREFAKDPNYWMEMLEPPFYGSYTYAVNDTQMTVMLQVE